LGEFEGGLIGGLVDLKFLELLKVKLVELGFGELQVQDLPEMELVL
jgi:hypothetical protein